MALVTVSDLEFNTEQVDFGTCTVHESVVVTVKLTNKSVLPQKFGFIDLPQVRIKPHSHYVDADTTIQIHNLVHTS